MKLLLVALFVLAVESSSIQEKDEVTTDGWSPDPCFPHCTTPDEFTSPDPEMCIKTDCFDKPLCQQMCAMVMHCRAYEWILNNDDNDIFGETWCAVEGYGMCYCCECPDEVYEKMN
eukprot:TRINITY_DN16649_c0_g1_i1.p1 TRINITY_DN16649_c0_g1~~TRINITY_DN16649_c0_g1_i1.p1  ORF type:complete len:116 (+),score=17.68 TRINITY_DN16649_c0_g1_i1:58-405(+)